jgi:ATP-grasp domain, R2K clade family 3
MNIARLEEKLIVVSQEVGASVYDFDFDLHFACSHPHILESEETCVLRIGPIVDYAAEYQEKQNMGLRPVNSPAEHARASELEVWYPLIKDLTPRTMVFNTLPTAEEIEANFAWPVFLKGSRQTSKHNPELSVIADRVHYKSVAERYLNDPILHWQKPVVREFIPLVPVAGQVPGHVRPSLEYRSFWWYGECVGWDRYWYQIPPYESPDVADGFMVASQVAKRLNVPFLVVDVAKTTADCWIAIECNDAQESGYASIPPYELWRKILALVLQ